MIDYITNLSVLSSVFLILTCYVFLFSSGYFLNGILHSNKGRIFFGSLMMPLSFYYICVVLKFA